MGDSATDPTDMASALLMLRLTTAMAAMAHTDMASALLMPRLTTAMAATDPTDMASGLLTPRLTTAMAATDPTATASALLVPRLTTAIPDMVTDMARGPLMLTTDMAVMAHTDMASRLRTYSKREDTSGINQNYTLKPKVPRTDMIREFCNLLNETKIKLYTSW